MEKFDLNALGVKGLENKTLVEINGGSLSPISDLVVEAFCLVINALGIFGPSVVKENNERAAGDDYVIWADLGHR
jgi:hypothetical protein